MDMSGRDPEKDETRSGLNAPAPGTSSDDVLVVTGEASGDCYASQVVKAALAAAGPGRTVRFFGSGGDALRACGVDLLTDIHELSAIGPIEAFKLAGNYFRLFSGILREVKRRRTRVALLVDFPDFNLPLSGFLRRRGVQVLYYISPTVWAWRPGRIRVIRRNVSRLMCIFPFEEKLYRDRGVEVEYVGHPLLSTVSDIEPRDDFRRRYALPEGACLVSVLPGSRRKEVQHILPILLEALERIRAEMPDTLFVIPAASATVRAEIQGVISRWFDSGPRHLREEDLRVIDGDATNCLANSHAGIVKSGTSTLQAAVAGTPFIMVYRTTLPTWVLGQIILRNKYFCIVNLIADREIVPEILQKRLTGETTARAFLDVVRSESRYRKMKGELEEIRDTLGSRRAPESVAARLLEALGREPAASEGERNA
ncbi:MAG: lipid-A-disaccharide synthase [Acidobacteria bacterium]|nr:lipid-A-disaccharide synthase [Acidobacteriota bacterium]